VRSVILGLKDWIPSADVQSVTTKSKLYTLHKLDDVALDGLLLQAYNPISGLDLVWRDYVTANELPCQS